MGDDLYNLTKLAWAAWANDPRKNVDSDR